MTTITKNIEIPQDRRLQLNLDLPDDLPIGRAELRLTITPELPDRPRFEGLAGGLKEVDDGEGLALQRQWREEWPEPWEETGTDRAALIPAGELAEKIGDLLPPGELQAIRNEARLGYPGKPFNPGQGLAGDHPEND